MERHDHPPVTTTSPSANYSTTTATTASSAMIPVTMMASPQDPLFLPGPFYPLPTTTATAYVAHHRVLRQEQQERPRQQQQSMPKRVAEQWRIVEGLENEVAFLVDKASTLLVNIRTSQGACPDDTMRSSDVARELSNDFKEFDSAITQLKREWIKLEETIRGVLESWGDQKRQRSPSEDDEQHEPASKRQKPLL